MKSYSVEAFILRLRALGESDRILSLFSAERGQLDAVAKGVRQTRSKFGARLDFFSRSALQLHAGRSLDVITSAVTVSSVWEQLGDPDVFGFASYAAEVIDALCEPDMPVPEIYDLLVNLHDAFRNRIAVGRLRPAFDLLLLRALGLAPELESCSRCGATLGNRPLSGGRGTLSTHAGGLLCSRCAHAGDDASDLSSAGGRFSVRPADLAVLRELATISDFAHLPDDVSESAARASQAFVQYHLGRRSRALVVADADAAVLRRAEKARPAR